MTASRHPLVVGTRWLLPAGDAAGARRRGRRARDAGAHHRRRLRGARRRRLVVAGAPSADAASLDDDGYAIEQRGHEKLRVTWGEVQKVRVDRRETALYVDTGDAARNLFVPPRTRLRLPLRRAEAIVRARAGGGAGRCASIEVERIDVS